MSDSLLLQYIPKLIPVLHRYGVLMEYMVVELLLLGSNDIRISEGLAVDLRVSSSFFGPPVQMFQFHGEYGGLEGIQSAVVSDYGVIVFWLGPVYPQHSQKLIHFRIAGHYHPPVPGRSQVFTGKEGETSKVAQGPGLFAFVLGPNGLSGILHHLHIVLVGDLDDWIHVRTLAV